MTKTSRKLHLWLSLLFAPSLIFFAFTGTLMMFGAGGALGKLSEVHTVQSIDERPARTQKRAPSENQPERVAIRGTAPPASISDAAPATPVAAVPVRTPLHRSLPLMVWFAALAVGLVAASGFGVYLAFAYKRDRRLVLGLLAAGVVIPVVLAFL